MLWFRYHKVWSWDDYHQSNTELCSHHTGETEKDWPLFLLIMKYPSNYTTKRNRGWITLFNHNRCQLKLSSCQWLLLLYPAQSQNPTTFWRWIEKNDYILKRRNSFWKKKLRHKKWDNSFKTLPLYIHWSQKFVPEFKLLNAWFTWKMLILASCGPLKVHFSNTQLVPLKSSWLTSIIIQLFCLQAKPLRCCDIT